MFYLGLRIHLSALLNIHQLWASLA